MYVVYKTTNLVNSKFYIGLSVGGYSITEKFEKGVDNGRK